MSLAEKLYDSLVANVSIEENPDYATWPVGRQLLYVTAQLGEALYGAYEILESSDTEDDRVIVEAVERFYDRYFVPIDLPVNDVFERIGESFGRRAISQAVASLASLIQSRNKE